MTEAVKPPPCKTCRFFVVAKKEESSVIGAAPMATGSCYRNPPTVHAIQTAHAITSAPQIQLIPLNPVLPEMHWCGEHESKID